MVDVGMKRIPRGRGWHNTGATISPENYGGVEYEGTVRVFNDRELSNRGSLRSARDVVMVLVRNVSTVALAPKRLVRWKAGQYGKRVDGYTSTTADPAVAGVVDELWPTAGVPVGELFWLHVKGPCLVKTSVATTECAINELGYLVAAPAAASTGTAAGRIAPQDLSGATQVLGGQIQNCIGRALSSNTSGQTNRDLLVDLQLA